MANSSGAEKADGTQLRRKEEQKKAEELQKLGRKKERKKLRM